MNFTVSMTTRGVDVARYQQVFFSEDFNREVVAAVNLKQRVIREQLTQADGAQYTRVRVVPKVALPSPITKLVEGHEIFYDEIMVFDPASRSARFAIESLAGDRVQVTGIVRFIEETDHVACHFEGEARVNVFAIGGLIERFIVSDVRKRYALVERALQRFVDEARDAAP